MSVLVEANPANIGRAAELLRRGELVAFPTETVYGLGADARDEAAVGSIYRAKGRPRSHPLIVHVPDLDAARAWVATVPEAATRLAGAFWPGPLTLVLRRAAWVPDTVTGAQATVALRVPAQPVAMALLEAVPGGVAAPSANRFGRVSPTRAEHVLDEFPNLDLMILDGGPCSVGVESTILDLSADAPRLLRPGGTALDAIEDVLGASVGVPADPGDGEGPADEGSAVPRVPGSLPSHYAPRATTSLVRPEELASMTAELDERFAVLSRGPRPAACAARWWSMPSEPRAYARALYHALRTADAAGTRRILVETVPRDEAWRAVRDRLSRAAASSSPVGSAGRSGP